MSQLCLNEQKIIESRRDAKTNLENQAKKMKMSSDGQFPIPEIGETVRIAVPDVDRGKGDCYGQNWRWPLQTRVSTRHVKTIVREITILGL